MSDYFIWVKLHLCSWPFRKGYSFQSVDANWVDWCGGGPLDNELFRGNPGGEWKVVS